MKSNQLLGMDRAELVELMAGLGEKPFRGRQLYRHLYHRRQITAASMTDLPRGLRSLLGDRFRIDLPELGKKSISRDGTVKFLFRLEDGKVIESVFIPEEKRHTLCISSQAGCNVGCTFCMTAQMGLQRNLRVGEIIGQVLRVIELGFLNENGFNIVFMGMGEPLYNFRNVMKAFHILIDPAAMGLSPRKITISTAGVVPVLERLAESSPVPNLAVSLNASCNAVRDRIMPINRKWPLEELMAVCRKFPAGSRRRITFEYVLLQEENDWDEDARRLAQLLRGLPGKVNLIPYNPNPGLSHRRPDERRIDRFRKVLVASGIDAFVRKTRGRDISAACGQLAHLDRNRMAALHGAA